jgi:flagellar hook-basal body complex protein FliE
MSIQGINPLLPQVPSLKGVEETQKKAQSGEKGGAFVDVLQNALKEVNDLQNEANSNIEGLALKREGVTPHGAMLALEKADVAFQLMNAIRGKIVRAYEEVIRTQI